MRLSWLFLLFFPLILGAQVFTDEVILKNGSVLKGKIIEYKTDENIKVEIQGGSILVYPASEVSEIKRNTQRTNSVAEILENPKHFYQKEYYISTYLQFIGGFIESQMLGGLDVPSLGIGLKASAGYAFNRHLMLGAGIGWAYLNNSIMYSSHIPLFAELRGDIIRKKNALYYSLGLGYNFVLLRKGPDWFTDYQMKTAQGGYFIHPALGFRFMSETKLHFCIEFSYSISTASFTYENSVGDQLGPTKNLFLRPALSVGLLF